MGGGCRGESWSWTTDHGPDCLNFVQIDVMRFGLYIVFGLFFTHHQKRVRVLTIDVMLSEKGQITYTG